jgi:CBS domain-containing protein
LESVFRNEPDRRKKSTIANLYRYSDLSVEAIAQQVDVDLHTVQRIIDQLVKDEALEIFVDQSTMAVEKVMTPKVITLDCTCTAREAALLMAENEIGSIIVTKNGKPWAIVTHSDIVRWAGLRPVLLDANLEGQASKPLIVVCPGTTIEAAAQTMIKNEVHKLPVVDNEENLRGIITITDLAVFLSPSRRPGLASSVLQAISRGKSPQQ